MMQKDWAIDGMPRVWASPLKVKRAPRWGAYFRSSGGSGSMVVAGALVGSLLLFVRRVAFARRVVAGLAWFWGEGPPRQ